MHELPRLDPHGPPGGQLVGARRRGRPHHRGRRPLVRAPAASAWRSRHRSLRSSADIDGAVDAIRAWGERCDWTGWDPYDALNSPFAPALTLGRPLGRRLLTQVVKGSPVNLRPLLRIPQERDAKGVALAASAYARLAAARADDSAAARGPAARRVARRERRAGRGRQRLGLPLRRPDPLLPLPARGAERDRDDVRRPRAARPARAARRHGRRRRRCSAPPRSSSTRCSHAGRGRTSATSARSST